MGKQSFAKKTIQRIKAKLEMGIGDRVLLEDAQTCLEDNEEYIKTLEAEVEQYRKRDAETNKFVSELKEIEACKEYYIKICNQMKSGQLREVEAELKASKEELRAARALVAGGSGTMSHGSKRRKLLITGGKYMAALQHRATMCEHYRRCLAVLRQYQAREKECKARITKRDNV